MRIIHFGTDGWRARFDDDFTDENVSRVADAIGTLWAGSCPAATVIVGYDTRRGAARHARLVAEVLGSHGLAAEVSDAPCPTPALGWAVAHDEGACGGVMLTASGSPCEYQGICIRMSDGSSAPRDFVDRVESLVPGDPVDARGPVGFIDLMTPYLASLASSVDAGLIRRAGLRVVVDPMYGSARGCLARLLSDMGVDVDEVHGGDAEDFRGIHPEPVEPWLDDCEREVVATSAAAGLVLDGDGDRVGLVDEGGCFVTPHRMVPLVLSHLVEGRGATGRVVVTLSESAYIRRQAKRLGCPLTVTPIGFRWIYGEMCRGDVLLGAEEYGGVGLPSHLYERDGLLVCLLMVECMARTGLTMGGLVADLEDKVGHMDYARRDMRLDVATIQTFRNLLPGLNPASVAGRVPCEVSHADGLRLRFDDDAWVLLRPSRTESVVRVYAEAGTVAERDALLEGACAIARGEA